MILDPDDRKLVLAGGGILIVIILVIMIGWPIYRVWQRTKSGEATLNEATYSRQVAVEEAKAKLESAKLEAKAEVERAKGVAEANKIIGDSLKDNEAYLRWRWIEGISDAGKEVIYVPTETQLPILEAGRHNTTKK